MTDRAGAGKRGDKRHCAACRKWRTGYPHHYQVLALRVLPLLQENSTIWSRSSALTAKPGNAWRATPRTGWRDRMPTSWPEAMHEAIAAQAKTLDAGPLPDSMVFPARFAAGFSAQEYLRRVSTR